MNETYFSWIKHGRIDWVQSCLPVSVRFAVVTSCWLIVLVAGGAVSAPFSYAQVQAESASAAIATRSDTININTADAQTLAHKLKGVGEARAGDIVRYREIYGPFVSVEELAEVKGIGQSIIDRNRDVITLE